MASLRRSRTLPTDAAIAKFLYTILKQLDLKSIDWQVVADQLDITNGHAARMRFSRFKQQMEGIPSTPRKPRATNPGPKKTRQDKASTRNTSTNGEVQQQLPPLKPEPGEATNPMEGIEPSIKAEAGVKLEMPIGFEPTMKPEPVVKSEPREESGGVVSTGCTMAQGFGSDSGPSEGFGNLGAPYVQVEESRPASPGTAPVKAEPVFKTEPRWDV